MAVWGEWVNDLWQRVLDLGLEKVIPSRRKGEKKKKFLDRCMASETMNQEFPKPAQRFAICNRQAERRSDDETDK